MRTREMLVILSWLTALSSPIVHAADDDVLQTLHCADTASPAVKRTFCFDQSSGALYKWNGSAWVAIGSRPLPSYRTTTLPNPGIPGRLARVTDDGGVWMDQGSQWYSLQGEVIFVEAFGAKGDGVADDTAAIQSALDQLQAGWPAHRKVVIFSRPKYRITNTLTVSGLNGIRLMGLGGWDGADPIVNNGAKTRIFYDGPVVDTKPVLSLLHTKGALVEGLTIDANYKAGYALHLGIGVAKENTVHNIVQHCSITHARRDGILIGNDTVPPGGPAYRQAYNNSILYTKFYGNQRSQIHVNEHNADMTSIEHSWFFPDETSTWPVHNSIWLERAGGLVRVVASEFEDAVMVNGDATSGYMLRNDEAGADGLYLEDLWVDPAGVLFDHSSGGITKHPSIFVNVHHYFAAGVNGRAMDLQPFDVRNYTFLGGEYAADILCNAKVLKPNLRSVGVLFAAGKGFRDYNGALTTGDVGKDAIASESLGGGDGSLAGHASTHSITLTGQVGTLWPVSAFEGERLTLVIRQGGRGGFTLAWGPSWWFGSGNPTPNLTAGAITTFAFVYAGGKYRLLSRQE